MGVKIKLVRLKEERTLVIQNIRLFLEACLNKLEGLEKLPYIGVQHNLRAQFERLLLNVNSPLGRNADLKLLIYKGKLMSLANELEKLERTVNRFEARGSLYESAYMVYLDECELDSIVEDLRYTYTEFLEAALEQFRAGSGRIYDIVNRFQAPELSRPK